MSLSLLGLILLWLPIAWCQSINTCAVVVSAQNKSGENIEISRWPCLVAQFGPQQDIPRALLVKAVPYTACTPLTLEPPPTGKWVALATRTVNNCTFYMKTLNAYATGASAILIGNDVVEAGPISMDYTLNDAPIPAYSISNVARNALVALLDKYGNLTDGTKVLVSVSLQQKSSAQSMFQPLAKQFFLFFLPTLLGALFLVCAVLSFILVYRRQRQNQQRQLHQQVIYSASPIDLLILRSQREQKLENMEVVVYKKPAADDDLVSGGVYCSRCAVCLEDFVAGDEVRILPCKHVYHQACIDDWLLDQGLCPYCKMDIVSSAYVAEDYKSQVTRDPQNRTAHTIIEVDNETSEAPPLGQQRSELGPVSV